MRKRRENSGIFGGGRARSPHVLDLRPKEVSKIRKGRKKKIKIDEPLSRDELMEELSNLERHEVELAATLRPERQVTFKLIPPKRADESRISLFWNADSAPERKDSIFLKTRNFAFFSGIFAAALLVSFSIQKGVSLKNLGMQKSITAYEDFRIAEASLKSLDFDSAAKSFSFAYAELASVESSLQGVGWLSSALVRHIPRLASSLDSGVALLSAGKHVASAGEIISSAAGLIPLGGSVSPESFLAFFSKEKTGESNDTEKKFEAFGEKAEAAERELNLAENEMKRVEQDLFPQEFQKAIVELRKNLPLLEDGVRILKDYSRILSPLLGEDSPKRYLIIFQNSSE
ncbi:MAG: hypothetical protein HYS15_03150, partial [Candidatus Spechtbacteria bacterium]|nr:hypothetical protein [Candidatus Spechtbacteria bacterium]